MHARVCKRHVLKLGLLHRQLGVGALLDLALQRFGIGTALVLHVLVLGRLPREG